MLDISPEKLLMLLAVGLIVLGPNKLPTAARSLAHGLARARRLAAALTDPLTTTLVEPIRANLADFAAPLKHDLTEPLRAGLAEPRQALDDAVSDLRTTIANHPLTAPSSATSNPVDPSPN